MSAKDLIGTRIQFTPCRRCGLGCKSEREGIAAGDGAFGLVGKLDGGELGGCIRRRAQPTHPRQDIAVTAFDASRERIGIELRAQLIRDHRAAYQLGGAIFGGFTLIIGVMLSTSYLGQWLPLAIFYSVLAGVLLLGVVLLSYAGFATKYGQANTAPVISVKAVAAN